MAKKDVKNLKKDAVDLEGNVIRTTQEEEAIARQQLEAQRAKEEADNGTSKDVEEAERKRIDLEGKEESSKTAHQEDGVQGDTQAEASEEKSEPEIDETTEEDKKEDKSEESESGDAKADAEGSESDGDENTESDEEKSDNTDEESEKTEDVGEPAKSEESDVVEEQKSEESLETEESKEEVKETGDFEVRMTKMEEKMDQILKALSKSDEEVVVETPTEADEAEKVEESETEVVEESKSLESEESEKSEKIEVAKFDSSEQIAKIEGELKQAKDEISKREEEIEQLKKMARPSKILSPFAVAKGMEFYSEPEVEMNKITDRLAQIDQIKKDSPSLYEGDRKLQEEAFRLVKVKKDIEWQTS